MGQRLAGNFPGTTLATVTFSSSSEIDPTGEAEPNSESFLERVNDHRLTPVIPLTDSGGPESETVQANKAIDGGPSATRFELAIRLENQISRDGAATCTGHEENLCGAIARWKRECRCAVADAGHQNGPLQVYDTEGVLEESTRAIAHAEVMPPVLERGLAGSADNVESFGLRDGVHRLHEEGRHLCPGNRSRGTVVATSTAARDAAARQLLDERAERAASWHVVEHLLARHARGGLADIQGFGQS